MGDVRNVESIEFRGWKMQWMRRRDLRRLVRMEKRRWGGLGKEGGMVLDSV